jgi:Holliday junction resolvase
MNHKRKGTAREHRSISLFEALGMHCIRAAGSLGPWDFVAMDSLSIVLCQVKSRDWPSQGEIEAMQQWPAPANAKKIIHRWRNRQGLPDVKEVKG